MSLENLPRWAQELADKYVSGSASLFVLYGNVDDWVPLRGDKSLRFVSSATSSRLPSSARATR